MKLFLAVTLLSFIAGCSPGTDSAENKIVAQVNNYKMTTEDLRYEFKNAPADNIDRVKTEKGRKEYLEAIIEKEVLLQEAQAQAIDREKDFMKSIENYWEQALLKILLDRKSREIQAMTHVYDNEIESYYKDSGEDMPLAKVKNEIMKIIEQEKETDAMNAWINDLKTKSYIKVDENAIQEAFSITK